MLTHIEEPFKAKQFGGDPASLQYVTSYLKSMSELARNTEALKKKEVERDEDASTSQSQRDLAKGNKKETAREGEGQADHRCLSRVRACTADGSSKSFPMHPIVQSLEASWGSFGRFLKLIKSKSFHDRKVGLDTATTTKGDSLFPSLLVIPQRLGESRSARRRARRRDRCEAWEYAEIVWTYSLSLTEVVP
jgi:hypothetical protein